MAAEQTNERRLPQLALVAACGVALWVGGSVLPLVQEYLDARGHLPFGELAKQVVVTVSSAPLGVLALEAIVLLALTSAVRGNAGVGRAAAAIIAVVAAVQMAAQLALTADGIVGQGWIFELTSGGDRAVLVVIMGSQAVLLAALAWWNLQWAAARVEEVPHV